MNFPPAIGLHQEYLRRSVVTFMTSTVEIVRPLVPLYDPVTGISAAGSDTGYSGYTGMAQLSKSTSAGVVMSGESYSEISTIQVMLPNNATPIPRADDQVIVLTCPEDTQLEGEVLRVIDVSYGGLTDPYRTLSCTFASATPFNPNS